MTPVKFFGLLSSLAMVTALPAKEKSQPERIRIEHEIREIEGWKVHVDVSLLEGKHKKMGELALRVARERLHQIALRMPAEPVAKMKEVPIYLDRNHPLGNAHYHPSAAWLKSRGYDPAMAKAVQITGAASLIREAQRPYSASVLLHELAHAYHERILDFDHPEILAGYRKFCDSRKFDHTPHVAGPKKAHYGLTDHKEFFAEMTETFFVGNSYYPFNHYELYQEHPETYELIARIWGTDIKPPKEQDSRRPSILNLRIRANLLSQRGDFEGALKLVSEAEKRSSDSEGRLAGLRKKIEGERAKAAKTEAAQ
ncbi:MAG: hypothetical protein AB8D78_11665 [Akkermansiaceae bacterium]